MGDWRDRHAGKLASPAEAIGLVAPGRRILVGSGAAEPAALIKALIEHGEHLADNEIVHLLTLGAAPYVRADMADRFRHKAFFIGANVREAVSDGRADFVPVFLSEIPELIRRRRVPIDVALVQVSPPDAHGYVSLGVSVDIVRAAVDTAALVLAEVNPRMPRTHGDSFLHVDRIARLIPVDAELPERPGEEPGEVERAIAAHVASLVPHGATLQTGIGKLPDAVLSALSGHSDLGVHTEMLSDGIRRLVDAGVINGRKKTLLPGKLVTSFVMGSRELYRWADDHPALEMRPSDFTNDPQVIARNEGMVSINSALAVDLTGQVASDTVTGKFFSGIGGQVDFVRGASRSKGGKAIIALPSTAKKGKLSRIQAAFEEGAGVVTSRGDVRYVVTEYGVADLWGKSVRERALALIEVAHPDFRGDLLDAAKKRRYVFPDQHVPRAVSTDASKKEKLASGVEVELRPVRLSDEPALQRLFYNLSDESVYRRFLAHKRIHPHEEMQALADTDHEESVGYVVIEPERGELVAMARYDVLDDGACAEIAFVVRDDWQGRGLATRLLRNMAETARKQGLEGFTADVLASNKPMLLVFHKSGLSVRSQLEDGVIHLEAKFAR